MHSSTVRYFDNWRYSEQNSARALRAEMADEQREGAAHAIVYPAKTNPNWAFNKRSSTCGNADAL
jgi:hypothetical protein